MTKKEERKAEGERETTDMDGDSPVAVSVTNQAEQLLGDKLLKCQRALSNSSREGFPGGGRASWRSRPGP